MKKNILLISLIAILTQLNWSQTVNDYRSASTGNWNSLTTWERFNGTAWVQPTGVPSSSSGVITIQNGHTVSILNVNQTADQITINAGGQVTINSPRTLTIASGTGTDLTVNGILKNSGTLTSNSGATIIFGSGSTYEHAKDAGTIPLATWALTSTCLITGTVATNPTVMGQTFGNLTWNCPSQTSDANFDAIFTVSGNFKLISSGSGVFRFPAGNSTISGNYSQTGGICRLANTSNRILNVAGNFSLSGGELRMSVGSAVGTINIAGNFSQTAGTITETSTGSGTIIFNGTSNQTYTGGGTISNTINFTLNNSAGLTLNTSVSFPATLTLTNGNIITGSNVLTLGTSSSNLGSLLRTSGKIVGNFKRWFATGTVSNVLFPIGTATNYTPANISFTNSIAVAGSLKVAFIPVDPGTAGLPLNDLGTSIINTGKEGYWTISAEDGLTGGVYSLDLTADGFSGVNNVATLRLLKRQTGGNWTLQGNHSAGTGTLTTPVVHRTGMSGFSEFGVGGASDNPLPVELSFFTAKILNSRDVRLNWRTETEVNNYGFEILRTTQNDDWLNIGFVEGNGNSNSPKEYSFVDENVTSGIYSYRLKQIDTDGKFEYSKVIEIDLGSPQKFELSQNYPNPFNPSTTIKFSLAETQLAKLIVYDVLGNEVAVPFSGTAEGGKLYESVFDGSNLSSGIYIYRLEAADKVKNKKMLLLK